MVPRIHSSKRISPLRDNYLCRSDMGWFIQKEENMQKLQIKPAIIRRKTRFTIREDVLEKLEEISTKSSVGVDELVEQILTYGLLSLPHQ